MVKKEIKSFELVTEGGSYPCTVPCSVGSVLSAAEADLEGIGSSVSFNTSITLDEVSLSIKHFYLRIEGVQRRAEVFLGDRLICVTDGKAPLYNVSLSGMLVKGDNLLSVRFYARDGALDLAALTKSFEIVRFNHAVINGVSIDQLHTEGQVTLGIKLDLMGGSDTVRAVATLVSATGQIYYAGLTGGRGSIVIKDPLYWWPKGLGVQNLYRLTVNLYGDTDVEDSAQMSVGLRTVDIGEGSVLVINGCEMIPMGAVYSPELSSDVLAAEFRMRRQVESAAMAGYNCIVVPVGQIPPSDGFYELCDKNGIVVIEEHSDLDVSVIESLKSRVNHPSLCLVDLMRTSDGALNIVGLKEALPVLRARSVEDTGKYVRSSALPSMKTIRASIPEGERSLFSRSVEAIAEGDAIREMLLSVQERYPYPADLSGFAYASALASANRVGEAVKRSRLSGGREGRAVFDRLGDSNLAISSSAIDFRGRWKPLQYYSFNHFAPLALYAETDGETVSFSASLHRRNELVGTLEYRIADNKNYTIYKSSLPISLSPMFYGEIHTAELGEYIKGHESEYYLEYYVKEGSVPLSRKTLLFLPEKHFDFVRPLIQSKISGKDNEFSITLSANAFVKDLEIDLDGVDAIFSDNYIDITGDAPIKIDFKISGPSQTDYHLNDLLQLRSLWDLK